MPEKTTPFSLHKTEGSARRGTLQTAHGTVETPAFMNVATAAAIRGGLSAPDLAELGCQVMLCNTYHLHLRPGDGAVRTLGGLHGMTGWRGPILTDSGGFQVFSLSSLRKIEERGVTFASHIDGARIFMGPEESIRIQSNLGSDIAMAFDECMENPAPADYATKSAARTVRWLKRCVAELAAIKERGNAINPGQMLFGINQGGTYDALRAEHMRQIAELDLPGYAIGGLAVGETADEMYHTIEVVEPHMPADRPRYLMGVGTPVNILEAVVRGIDLFDCVMPSRNARHGHLFTHDGVRNLNNQKYALSTAPPDPQCDCPTCRQFSLGYLRHLLKAGEMLGQRLCVQHNLYFYNRLMADIRLALEEGRFAAFKREQTERLGRRI